MSLSDIEAIVTARPGIWTHYTMEGVELLCILPYISWSSWGKMCVVNGTSIWVQVTESWNTGMRDRNTAQEVLSFNQLMRYGFGYTTSVTEYVSFSSSTVPNCAHLTKVDCGVIW